MAKINKVVFSTKYVNEITKRINDGEVVKKADNPWFKGEVGYRRSGLAFRITPEETEEYIKCATDIHYYANTYCKIKLEDGSINQMTLRDYQKDLLDLYFNNRKSIVMASRQIGKTVSAAIMILHFLTFNNDKGIMIMGNKLDTAIEIVDKIKSIYRLLPFFLQRGVKINNTKSMTFDNGCRIKTSGRTKAPAIGFTIDLLYMDEFAHIPSTILNPFYRAAYPTVSGVDNSKIIITSTPNGFNLFHKILTESELEEDDPRKNTYKSMRVYWQQVPGRNVTYLKLNDFKLYNHQVDKENLYDQLKAKFDPDNKKNDNNVPYMRQSHDYEDSKDIIHILNDETPVEEIRKFRVLNKHGEELPIFALGIISTWKEDTIKDIGGVENFNQEYDLRFLSGASSILSETTMERLLENKEAFEHQNHDVFDDALKWDYSNLRWTTNETIFTEANRKDYNITMTVDISEGLGEDYSVINIWRLMPKDIKTIKKQIKAYTKMSDFFKLKQIGIFRSNLVSAERELPEILYLLGFEYFDEDKVKITFEYNNDGKVLKASLPKVFEQNNNYGTHIMYRYKHRLDALKEEVGLKIGLNKNHMVKDYQDMVDRGDIEFTEETTVKEAGTFIKHQTPSGNFQYKADGSAHDDCVPHGTIINTIDGVKPIEDIKVGDFVLTHKGRYKEVLRIGNRYADHLYKISSCNKMDISLTSNHQLFIFNRDYKYNFNNGDWISIDNGLKLPDHKTNNKQYTSFIPNQEVEDIDYIDLYEYCDQNKFIIRDDKIYSILYEDKNRLNPKQNPINRFLKIDNDFCFIMGYYIAEGSRNGHQISFASHINENRFREKVFKYFKNLGLNPFEHTRGNSSSLCISSKTLSNFFKQFKSRSDKKLPSFCNSLPLIKRQNILNGYLLGDGCFSQEGMRAVSISPSISMYMYETMILLGYKPSLKLQKQPESSFNSKSYVYALSMNNFDKKDLLNNIEPILLESKNILYPTNVSDKKSWQINVNNYLLGSIQKIEKLEYNDVVYNLEVDEDNSYIANGIVVHNCIMTCVHATTVFPKTLFKDTIDEFYIKLNDIEFKKIVSEFLDTVEHSEGTDYGAFINATKSLRKDQRPHNPPNPFDKKF